MRLEPVGSRDDAGDAICLHAGRSALPLPWQPSEKMAVVLRPTGTGALSVTCRTSAATLRGVWAEGPEGGGLTDATGWVSWQERRSTPALGPMLPPRIRPRPRPATALQ